MNEISFEICHIETPKKIQLNNGQSFGFNEEHINIIKKGFIPKTMEDKWYIYSEDNWLFFHRAWTGQGIYKLEIKHINERYIIDEFYVERNIDKYDNTNDLFDIHILHIIIDWGLLGVDCRSLYLTLFNETESDTMRLWHILGNFFISLNEIKEYELEKEKKYPCKEIFKVFSEKIELFIGFIENLYYHNIIPIDELQNLFKEFINLAIKIEEINVKIDFLIKNKTKINKILEYIYENYSLVLSNINKIQNANLKYFKNDKRYFLFEDIINNLINNSSSISVEKTTIEKILSYKNIINDNIFNNQYMKRLDIY
jgi:hypothetical protein